MKGDALHSTRRAQRSLRWYPKAWRQRFGDEYVALLEDEILEQPRSARRSFNVAWKGSMARLADLGLVGSTLDSSAQVRAGAATSLFCGLFAVAVSVKLWAPPMVDWYWAQHRQLSWLLNLSTVLMTITYGIMAAVVIFALIGAFYSALWNILHRRGQGLKGAAAFMVASGVYLGIAENIALQNNWVPGGIRWTQPGTALKQFAMEEYRLFSEWESAATTIKSFYSLDRFVIALAPFVLVGFALAATTLIRRTAISQRTARFYQYGVTCFVGSLFICLGSFVVWDLAGGGTNFGVFTSGFPILQLGLVCVLALSSSAALIRTRSMKNRPLRR